MDDSYYFPVARIWSLIHTDVNPIVSDIAYLTAYVNHVNNWGRGGRGIQAIQRKMSHLKDVLKPLELEFTEAVRFIWQNNVRYLSARSLARLVRRTFCCLDFCINELIRQGYPRDRLGDNPQINMFAQKGLFDPSASSPGEQEIVKEIREAFKRIPVKVSDDTREVDMFDR